MLLPRRAVLLLLTAQSNAVLLLGVSGARSSLQQPPSFVKVDLAHSVLSNWLC